MSARIHISGGPHDGQTLTWETANSRRHQPASSPRHANSTDQHGPLLARSELGRPHNPRR